MKQLLLLGVACFLSASASAQLANNSVVKLNVGRTAGDQTMPARGKYVRPVDNSTAAKTTATTTRWYSHLETMGDVFGVPDIFADPNFNLFAMWQDSTVRYSDPAEPSGISESGIQYLSIANVFHPQSTTFTNASPTSNLGKQLIGANDAYTIDSIRVLGRYERLPTAPASSVDTLIFTLIPETSNGRFLVNNFGGAPDIVANYGIDSHKVQLWNASDFAVRAINQVSYSSTGSGMLGARIQVKLPLTQAIFNDSSSNGFHLLGVPFNTAIPKGRQAAVSITFKSGSPYTAGTAIDDYSFFAFGSGEINPGSFTNFLARDYNMSSIVHRDTTGFNAGTDLKYYLPTLVWTAPYRPEMHAIEFKTTCTTCDVVRPVGVASIDALVGSVVAYPNPSSTQLFVPVTLSKAADLSVTLSTPMGQVVARQDFGKVAAGQEMKATFNTAGLANGIYFYTVEVAGERITNRVVVSH